MRLRSSLNALAASFANSVLDVIRGASLEELLGESGGGARRGPGGPRASSTVSKPGRARAGKPGRKRRSAAEIAKALDQVVALVKKSKAGMRSEEIRKALKLDVHEVPRVLKEGLKKKKLIVRQRCHDRRERGCARRSVSGHVARPRGCYASL